ncbi:polysaccharide deacetylase family protein [Legionella nagasakiensis]|uniref:polysaccharide deacetylase family protein n=1 Tax=Legionella nagasakiensis TaxID=535290 RepID=UPI001F5E811D|nr:polysaccharide deacetylase family protein [Legionella nagasakiensis]
MSKLYYVLHTIVFLALTSISFAQNRQIAITMDDLPFVGESKNFHLNMIIESFKENEVPATGFIIAGNVKPEHWVMLRKFRDAGLGLGNHTSSHINLNKVDADVYIQDVDEADKLLEPILSEPKYFRYPYLEMGTNSKKKKVLQYLAAKNYQIAPVTIDSKDFIFNQLLLAVPENNRRSFMTVLKPAYLDFLWQQTIKAEERHRTSRKSEQPQILLIHANLLNAYTLPDIIAMYRQHGYRFVTLDEALKSKTGHSTFPFGRKADAKIESFMAWD